MIWGNKSSLMLHHNFDVNHNSLVLRPHLKLKKMDAQKVDMFLMMNSKYFEGHHLMAIKEALLRMDESKWSAIQILDFKDPTTSLIVSILAGTLGIDRFLIGDTGMGIGKLLTCGGFGIWAIVDYFLIMGATREKNFAKLQQVALY